MAAYVIVEVEVHDELAYEAYKQLTPATIAAYDGKFIVRGGKTEALVGDWKPQRVVVLQFPTMEKAKAWWDSPEYAPAKAIRQKAAHTKMLMVEGYQPL